MLRKLINYQSFLKRTYSVRKIAILLAVLLFVLSTPLLADIRGTDITGKPVILRSDGTWSYINPGGGDAKTCRDYANHAILQQRTNLRVKCDYTGPRWHIDYNKHYNGCMGSNAQWRVRETRIRSDALTRCTGPGGTGRVKYCRNYANQAVAQQKTNLRLKCNYTGAFWHLNYNNHYNWCVSASTGKPASQEKARRDALTRCTKIPPPPPPGTTIKLLNSVPSRDSKFFKPNTDNRLKMQTTKWDKVPYRMTRAFSGTIRLTPGRRAVLAGNAAGTAGWNVDNFLLIEISSGGRTRRLVVGAHEPVIMAGGVIQKIGRNSLSFGAGEIDLTPYLQVGKPVGLRVTAFDYGGTGHVSNVFLVMR